MVDSSKILNSSETLVVPVSIDCILSDASVISDTAEIVNTTKSGQIPLSADSVNSSISQIPISSGTSISNEILKSSKAFIVSPPVHVMNSDVTSPLVDLISDVSNIYQVTVSSCTLGISKSPEIFNSIETVDS